MKSARDNPFASPAAKIVVAQAIESATPNDDQQDIHFSGRIQQPDLQAIGIRSTSTAKTLALTGLCCLLAAPLWFIIVPQFLPPMASSAAGISGVLGYVLLLAAGCFAPPPAAKWWKHPVSGCVTKDHIVLQFEHLHIKAPIGFFNYEITDKAILVKQKKSRLTCLLLLPRRWLRPQDSAIVASRLKNTAEVQPTEDVEPILPANATPIYRPRSKSERSTRLFIAILGLSLWWILLTALGIANVVCNGYTFFYLLIVIGLTVNLAARYRNRNGAWKSNESPTGSCDLIGWLTDEQLIAFVQQTKVTVDISRIYYDTGTGGLEITGVPLRGSMALYPDLCPPGTFEQARKNLRTKTALVWNVYRHWKNRNSSTGNTPLR